MIRKTICLITFIISVVAIISMIITAGDLLSTLNISFDFEGLSFNEIVNGISLMFIAIFTVFGTPIIILLLSIIGLTIPSRRK